MDYDLLQQKISVKEARYNIIENKLSEIKKSLSMGVEFDLRRVSNLYNEFNKDFSTFIVKSLDEVLAFRSDLVQNRKKFLFEREFHYNKELTELQNEIELLENKKKTYYQNLEQKEILDDLKAAYSFLGDKKTRNEQNIVFLEEVDRNEREASITRNQISNIVNEMVLQKEKNDESLKDIKRIFYEIVHNSVETELTDLPTHLSIEPRSNVKSPISIDIQVPRSGSLGKDRFKILAFDSAVFLSIIENNRSLPHFLVHDGVFHGIAHKTRIKYLNYMKKKLDTYEDAQYIVTLNEDEISLPEDYSDTLTHLNFNVDKCTIKIMEDEPEKMFFKIEF